MLALLVSAGVAYAQGTPTLPTIESVAVTSDPGGDGGYAIGDEIQVGLTFSEAVTVTGIPQLTLDVGGQSRTAEYSEGSTTTQLLFTYTVPSGDEDTDGIAVVANSLALNGGAIRAGSTNATLTHAALQANDHKVDGTAPTVTVGGESRPYVPPDRQFNVVFYFSEKVYGITDAEITVTNGLAVDVQATGGNATWPKYTRWDVIIVPAAEGPVTVTLEAGAGADAYGNENTAPDSALEVIAATPVTVEVARTTSDFAEGGKSEFTVTRSTDNGAIPVFLSLDQTGDFLSGAVQVYPPADPNNPGEPVVPEEFTFTETPFTLNVTFAVGETSKRIAVPTEDDYRDEEDGTVTLSVPARPDQYKYIPGHASSATADVRDNDVPVTVSLYWIRSFHPYTRSNLDTALEGGSISLVVYGRATGQPLQVTLAVTEVGSYLDLDGDGAWGYENLGNGKLLVTLPVDLSFQNVVIPLVENDVREADGSVTITIEPDPERSYTPSVQFGELTVPVKDNDTPSTVSISAPDSITEGGPLSYTLTRTWAPGESQGELSVNVELAQTGNYITWPTAHQPDADGLVTIPVNFAARSLTATLTLETVDDQMSEDNGSVTATILADADGSYVTGADSAHTTKLLDNDLPVISVAAVSAEVTEGTDAQFRFSRAGNTSGATRVGLWVGGLPKIMTDATDAIALTADNADLSQRLHIYGAWVDYILEFAAGETEKTLSLTTEADNVNEGDGLLGVTIVQRAGNPFGIGTGYAQVLVKDDDIPTVSLTQPVGPTGFTLSADGTTWEGQLGETDRFTLSSVCTGVTEFSPDRRTNLAPLALWVMYANHPAHYGEDRQNHLGSNFANVRSVGGGDCAGTVLSVAAPLVGPENGLLEIELLAQSEFVPTGSPWNRLRPKVYDDFITQYEEAARAAAAAGTLITQKGIFSPARLTSNYRRLHCLETDFRYCPKYLVGTVNKIRLTVINRDPTILIKAENSQVEEGEPARFVVERLWNKALYANPAPVSTTVVSLRATQNGQYITGALPVEVTFGQNELRKVIELQTVDDGAFGPNGSLTIELLPDTTSGNVNLSGKYTTWTNWLGHTPDGGRSDRATVAIINNDDKPGISIAPTSALEGDSGSADMIFTVTLAKAVTEAVTINYATSDGTAIAGQDYTAVSNGAVTIAAGNTTAEFTVSVTGDETDELDETFNVTISMPEPEPDLNGGSSGEPAAAISGGDTAAAAGTILDDDPAVVTVAPKVDTVEEGEPAVFVLTRAGMTNGRLAMQVRLRSPGRLRTLDARFEPGAVTTEIAVATPNNNLVDYPSVRDYTIEVFGDGAPLGQDDRSFTPGVPATATVKVTDDDELINVTVYPVKAIISQGNPYWTFRRDGDISQPLSALFGYYLHKSDKSRTEITYGATARFEAGQDEVVTYHDYDFVADIEYPPEYKGIFPITLTYTVFGDGGQYGLHRIYQGGNPNTATVTMEYNGYERRLVVGAEAPLWVSVGQTVNIPLIVTNVGSLDSGTPITITSTHYSQDREVNGTNEPRMTCQFDGPIAAGESAGCEVSFLVLEKDLNWRNEAKIELDVVASDGRTTSNAFRIYMRVRNGVSVGFNETANLPVTEPGFGEANAKANLTVTRVGQSGEEVQVAYTLEPWPTGFRSYSPVEGVDYADNSATPGVITFGENETEKTITIDILGDQIDEAKEQFLVTLVPPEGVLVEEDKRTRIVVINDTNPPPGESYRPTASLQLIGSGPVPESEGPVEFAIVLDREWGIDALYEVELTLNQLTATPGIAQLGKKGDFEDPGVLVVRIPAGQTRFEFSIPLYDDDVREEDETFQLLLGSSIDKSFRTIGPSNTALATIADDDRVPPTEVVLSLSHNGSALESVPEGSNRQDITVTALFPQIRWPGDAANAPLRSADPRDVDTTVRVRFDPNSGATHAAGLDDFEPLRMEDALGEFQVVESFDIVIPAGQTSGNATVGFWPVKDDVDEQDETVTLQGSEVVAGNPEDSLPVRSASFTIIDDDTRGTTLSPAKLAAGTGISMMEGGTSTYSLVLDSEPTDTVTVTVAGRQGDLISLTLETLTFTPSDWSIAQTISVVSLDDGTDTSFTNAVISHQVSGGDYGSVTVRDIWMLIKNTTQAYIYLDDAQASESDGYVEFTVTVRPILRTTPVLVRYATVDGTAIAGSDYTQEVETGQTYKILNIPAGQSSGAIRIPIIDDQVYESADETFTLQLTNHNNKATLDGGATSLTATGAIADDDPKPVVSVAGPAGDVSYVSENAKDPVTFTLTLMGQSAGDVTVDYATGEAGLLGLLTARQGLAGATQDEDYAGTSGTVTFTPGQTTKTVTVQVTNDDVSEETEFFGFTISAPPGADLRGQRSEDVADVGLLDDDPRGVTIAPTSIGLDEPASGETAVAGSYTVNLNSRPTATVTVTIGGSDPAVLLSGGTLTNNRLTFTTTNWNTAQTITVTPVKDDDAVGETITLTHTLSGGDYAGIAADSVTVNLTDSDTRNLVLSGQSLTVTEGDATGVRYTVKLATQPSDTVTVTISGHDGADLTLSGTTLTNNQLTFSTTNWDTAQTVTVKAGDDDNTDDESETLAHTAFGGDYVNVTRDLPVTITDDDDPQVTVSFEQGAYTVAEGDMVTVTVTLSADPERTVEIELTATDQGGASSPADYTGVPASVTFNAGDTEQTFDFTAAQDDVDDDGERVRLSFGAMPDARVNPGTTSQTTVSITDDDTAGVTVSKGSLTIAEGSSGTYTIVLDSEPTATVTVTINDPTDNTDVTAEPASLTFSATDWNRPQEVTVRAAQDNDTSNETATVTHTVSSTDSSYSSASANSVAVNVSDDDPDVTVSFGAMSYTVAEGDMVSVTVTLSEAPGRPVEIPITATDQGGASSPADYTGVPASVTFGPTEMSQTITFEAATDAQDDDGEKVLLGFGTSLPAGVSGGTTTETTVSITDDDDPQVTVSFGAMSYTVAEGDMVTVTVTLSADPERMVEIELTATDQGGASSPADYTGVPASVTFNAGDTEQTFDFTAAQDDVDDDGERVRLSFGAMPDARVNPGTTSQTTVSITDDDTAGVTVSKGSLTIAEGSSGTYTIVLDSEPTATVTVTINDPTDNTDVTAEPASLTFSATDWNRPQEVTVRAAQDNDTSNETATVTHTVSSTDSSYSSASANSVAVNVSDDDPDVTVSFGAMSYTVAEGDMVSVTVTLSEAPGRPVEIPITATDQGGASSPADYTGVPASVTFGPTEMSQTITFEAATDAQDDDGEKVLLGFGTSLPAGVSGGTTTETTVSITDDDDPQVTVSFGAMSYTVAEGDMVTVTVTLSADPERTVEIELTATDQGGASSPADYTGVPLSVTFNAGDREQTFDFTAAQDDEDDDDEKVLLGFGTALPTGVSGGTTTETTVSITDDDDPAVTVSFEQDAYAVAEGDMVTVTVTLSADPERTVVIPIEATPQGDASSADYSVPLSVTFNAGDREQTFDFTAAQDDEDDDDEKVLLGFGTALPAGVSGGTTTETTVSISDDDVPAVTVSFEQGAYTVAEGDMVTVTVTLSADPERTVGIPIEATPQGDASSADYSVPLSVTFNAGDRDQTFDFTAAQDDEDDDGESVRLAFGTNLPSRVSAGTTTTTTVSITDDDDPQVTVSFEQDAYAVAEGDMVTVTVTLSADPERTVVIPIEATPQGDASSADYSVPLSVTFNAGDREQTFDFTAAQDDEDDDGESVRLAFGTNLPSRVSAGTTTTTTVSITDDDDPQVTVSFEQGAYTVAEGDRVTVTVTLSADPERTVVIPIEATPQGDASSADYSVPLSVTFNAGDREQTFDFTAAQDDEDDDDEKVLLGFGTSLPAGVSGGTTTETTVSISDDDVPAVTVSFEQGAYTVAEGDRVTVTVTLSADPERTVVIPIEATPQGDASSADYSVPLSVTFNAGDREQTFDFTAAQDDEDDDGESVRLAFGTNLPSRVSAGTTTTTTVSITDDDDPAVTVSFEQGAYTVAEGDMVTVTVTLSADPERTVVIPIEATPQGDASSADYSVPLSVTFNAGDREQTFDFTAAQDDEDDDGESVRLAFGTNLPSRVSAGTTTTTTVSITDDDDVPAVTVSFAQAAYSVGEGSWVSVSVSLVAAPGRPLVVPLVASGEGGASGRDYSGVPRSVSFGASDTLAQFTFAATQDTDNDDGESVKVRFGSSLPPGVSVGALAETVVRIDDDDDHLIQQQLGGNVDRRGTVVTIARVPDGTVGGGSTFIEGTEAPFRLKFEAVGGGPPVGNGVDVHLRYSWHIPSPLVTAHGYHGYASQGTWSLPRVDVWDSAVPIHDNDFGNPDGTLTIRIIGCERSGCVIGTPSEITLTITDDDGGPEAAVPGPPDAPRLVCARSGDGYDDTGIAVRWKAPNFVGGAPVQSYELRYRQSSLFVGGKLIEHPWQSWPHGVAATSATITGLVTRADYTVQVRAVNGDGPGLWSEPWSFRVGPIHEVCEIIDQLTPP